MTSRAASLLPWAALAAASVCALPAHANQDVEAEEFRAGISGFLNALGVEAASTLTVTPPDEGSPTFEATLPGLALDFGPYRVELGTVTALMTPLDDDHVAFSLDLSHKEALLQEFGSPAGRAVVGRFTIDGSWSRSQLALAGLDLRADDLALITELQLDDGTPVERRRVAFGSVALAVGSTPAGEGRWDRTLRLDLADMAEITPDGTLSSIGAFTATVEVGGLDMQRYGEVGSLLMALAGLGQPLPLWPEIDPPTTLATLFQVPLFNDFTIGVSAGGVAGAHAPSVEGFKATLAAEGFGGEVGRIELRGAISGVSLPGYADPELVRFRPTSGAITASIEALPVGAAYRAAANLAASTTGSGMLGTMMTMIGLGGAKITFLLFASPATLRLDHLSVAAPSGRIDASGALTLDPIAALMARGNGRLAAVGLDAWLAALTKRGMTAELGGLELLRSLGERGAEPDSYDYMLTLEPDGRMLINGNDVRPIVQSVLQPY